MLVPTNWVLTLCRNRPNIHPTRQAKGPRRRGRVLRNRNLTSRKKLRVNILPDGHSDPKRRKKFSLAPAVSSRAGRPLRSVRNSHRAPNVLAPNVPCFEHRMSLHAMYLHRCPFEANPLLLGRSSRRSLEQGIHPNLLMLRRDQPRRHAKRGKFGRILQIPC